MRKIFITGASGFVGTHLVKYLSSLGKNTIFGTTFGETDTTLKKWLPNEQIFTVNLLDRNAIDAIINQVKPDAIVHLAALSSAALSFSQAAETITNNAVAQINLLDAIAKLKKKPKTLIIGSAEEYGIVKKEESPVTETNPLRPLSPYAVSKITQDFLGYQYYLTYNIPIVRLRPFNHTGEGHAPTFVIPAFAKQVAEIEFGLRDHVMVVGDTSVVRDFTHVDDMVKAYELALHFCRAGEVYNVGSGKPVKIQSILDLLLTLTSAKISVKTNPSKFRPADVKILVCDATKFKNATNWQPQIGLKETVTRVLNYWRGKIKEAHGKI